MAGDVTLVYVAPTTLTQTALDDLNSSPNFIGGWESDAIDNSSNLYLDYRITAMLKVTTSVAAEIRMYLVAELNDTTWPDVFDGTQSTESVTDVNVRDAICRLAASTATDTTASQVYYLHCPSAAAVFDGQLPRKFVIFIAQNTGNALEFTGDPNQVYVAGAYGTVAQS